MLKYPRLKLKNYMEVVVEQNLDVVLKGYDDICTCEQCRLDIMALVLNEMPPRYVVTAIGETYMKTQVLDHQFKADIYTAISRAVNIVKDSPRHDHQNKE